MIKNLYSGTNVKVYSILYVNDTIHNCFYCMNQIMHVDKNIELSKTQISQHLAWLSTFLKL